MIKYSNAFSSLIVNLMTEAKMARTVVQPGKKSWSMEMTRRLVKKWKRDEKLSISFRFRNFFTFFFLVVQKCYHEIVRFPYNCVWSHAGGFCGCKKNGEKSEKSRAQIGKQKTESEEKNWNFLCFSFQHCHIHSGICIQSVGKLDFLFLSDFNFPIFHFFTFFSSR